MERKIYMVNRIIMVVSDLGEVIGLVMMCFGLFGLFFKTLKYFWLGVIVYLVSISLPAFLGGL